MERRTFETSGVAYDLSHLESYTIQVAPKAVGAPTFTVMVSFGHHTFTREWQQGVDQPDLLFVHKNDRRCFCVDRYALSLNLRAIVANAVGRKAYFSNQKVNYLLIEDVSGRAEPYAVFFKMEKATSKQFDAAMFVISAYPKANLPKRSELPAISFATLVAKTARGEPVIRPKK